MPSNTHYEQQFSWMRSFQHHGNRQRKRKVWEMFQWSFRFRFCETVSQWKSLCKDPVSDQPGIFLILRLAGVFPFSRLLRFLRTLPIRCCPLLKQNCWHGAGVKIHLKREFPWKQCFEDNDFEMLRRGDNSLNDFLLGGGGSTISCWDGWYSYVWLKFFKYLPWDSPQHRQKSVLFAGFFSGSSNAPVSFDIFFSGLCTRSFLSSVLEQEKEFFCVERRSFWKGWNSVLVLACKGCAVSVKSCSWCFRTHAALTLKAWTWDGIEKCFVCEVFAASTFERCTEGGKTKFQPVLNQVKVHVHNSTKTTQYSCFLAVRKTPREIFMNWKWSHPEGQWKNLPSWNDH